MMKEITWRHWLVIALLYLALPYIIETIKSGSSGNDNTNASQHPAWVKSYFQSRTGGQFTVERGGWIE